ncbi:hypothetical protein G647_03789 [Cladophialophora carrionii CBS 160.54]|uniref:Uncharacterized protein n=1 Tax=Cladophialophora carrionii CBS 160.54 TaxID=1279043 RepID=V9DC56_9EURO|nr:uncharacterized protein G647_03789 [Cladophialophora carrionii CBS 160.54]ETI24420.1 hypothetical protein G647_03789 [Cladophialophora carrionii CBS 160.54]
MEPLLRVLMAEEPVSMTPQRAFEQADDLLQQAAALRENANDLREQADFMYQRANTLTKTAKGLQQIAYQDREAMQVMWDKILRMSKEDFELYLSDSNHAARFKEMATRVEDGLVNVDQMNAFLSDFLDSIDSGNHRRSAAPEPEIPAMGEQAARSLLEPEPICKPTLKRRISTANEGDEAVPYPAAKRLKRMRHNEESGPSSDGDKTINGQAVRPRSRAPTDRIVCSPQASTDAGETSGTESDSAEYEESGGHRVGSEATDSSDEEEKASSTSSDIHTTTEACDSVDENSSTSSDDTKSESGRSCTPTSTSASS